MRVTLLPPCILRRSPGCFHILAVVSNAAVTRARGWAGDAGHGPGARDVGLRGTETAPAGCGALPGDAARPGVVLSLPRGVAALRPGSARPEAVVRDHARPGRRPVIGGVFPSPGRCEKMAEPRRVVTRLGGFHRPHSPSLCPTRNPLHRPQATDPALRARHKDAVTATGHGLPDCGETAPRSWRPLRVQKSCWRP